MRCDCLHESQACPCTPTQPAWRRCGGCKGDGVLPVAALSRTADATGEHDSTRLGGPPQADEMDVFHVWEDIITEGEAPMPQ